MEYLVAFGIALGCVIVFGILAVVWACCSVASDADDAMEKWSHQ